MIDKKLIRKMAKALDDDFEFKGLLEVFDGIFFRMILNVVNSEVIDKLPGEVVNIIAQIMESYVERDFAQLDTLMIADNLNKMIDIPGINETTEGVVFDAGIRMVTGLIKLKTAA